MTVAIIPAFNEENSIGTVVLKTMQYVDKVIVVDDGSTDKTAEVASLAGAHVVRHEKNMGKGEALKTGFKIAGENGTKVIVTIDADGQHDPDEIPKVIGPILAKEADMVIGSRYLNGNQIPFYRRVGQNILDRATNLNSGIKITDTQSGFRAFAMEKVGNFKFGQKGFSIESEMLTEAAEAKLIVKEVDIRVKYEGVDCSTENPIIHGLKVLVSILHDIEFKKPLYYFTVPGGIMSMVGLGMGLLFLDEFYHGEDLKFGPTLLMILLTLVGIFMTFTGMILHSISRLIGNKKF